MRAKLLSDPVCPSLIQICNFVFIHKWICDSFLCNRSWELLSIQSSNNLFTIFKETKRYKNCVFFSWNYKSHPIITNRSQKKLLRIHLSRVLFILIASLLLYVKEVYWPILYSNLLYKIGHYFLDGLYVHCTVCPFFFKTTRLFLWTSPSVWMWVTVNILTSY